MSDSAIKKRNKTIRCRLSEDEIDCLVVTKPANVTYVTGFSGDDSWAVITGRKVYLITDSRFIEQAEKECRGCGIIERKKPMAEAAGGLIRKLKYVRTAAVERTTSIAAFEGLKKSSGRRFKQAENIIEAVRSSKDEGEIAAVRTAAQIAANALEQTIRDVRPGISENELAGLLDLQIRRLGAKNSFETIAAFGSNASRPHHQPGKRKLRKNDTILIDFGARYKNYRCDLTRCFVTGRINPFYEKVYNAVQEAQAAAIKMVKAGVEIRKIDAAAREAIRRYNLPVYGHGTGHGLGLEVHEGPAVSSQSKGELKAGEIITIEPAVYMPGRLGVRIEDDVLVKENGCEILSRNCHKQLFIISTGQDLC
jgi:Xaa-Pro aminopeptidase